MGLFTNTLKGNPKTITATPAKQSTKVTTAAKIGGLAGAIAAAVKKNNSGSSTGSKKTTSTSTSTTTTEGGSAESSVDKSVLLQWKDVKFFANASKVVGMRDLAINATCETEDKEDNGNKYVKLKNKKGFEISFTAYFDKRLGIADVRGDALALAGYAAAGESGYIYCRGDKLVPTNMMATSGKIKNVQMTPGGSWISCEVEMTFKSCSKLGDTGSGSDSSSSNSGPWTAVVYYSGSSGAVQSVKATSNVSYADAQKKAYEKVPKNAQWASTKKNQASNQTVGKVSTAANQQKNAKTQSDKIKR